MKALLSVLGLTALVGCSAFSRRSESYLTVGRIRIEASSPLSEPTADVARRFDPIVRRLLGCAWEGSIEVRFRDETQGGGGHTVLPDRVVVVDRDLTLERLELVIGHELAHCHMDDDWTDLPAAVVEGVAYLCAAIARGQVSSYGGPPPESGALKLALTLSRRQLYRLSAKERLRVEQAGIWVAGGLIGLEEDEADRLARARESFGLGHRPPSSSD